MMAAWMLYTLLTTLLLVIAGIAAERLMRAVRAPARLAWTCVIVTAIALSALSLSGRRAARGPVALEHAPARLPVPSPADSFARGSAMMIAPTRAAEVGRPTSSARWLSGAAVLRFDQARWERYDALLAVVCLSSAVAGILVATFSLVRLRRVSRTFSPGELDGVPVLASNDIGPAVVGFVRPRVVIPRWVGALSSDERRTILLHEQEHASARDPVLLLLGVVALAVQPWNVALWVAVARLRFALEVDCDARVLARSACGARRYGALLLQVHERTSAIGSSMAVTPFVASRSHLERRVRRMTVRQPRVRSLSTLSAVLIVVVAAGVAFSVRVSGAREAARTTPPLRPERSAMPPAARAVAPVADDAAAASPGSDAVIPQLLRNALPGLANSEHATPLAGVRATLSQTPPMARPSGSADWSAVQTTFVPETLLLQASNPVWPMKARITFSGPGAEQVVVTNKAGHTLPTADTLVVEGAPVQLVLPEAAFRLKVESLAGDLSVTTSPIPGRDGRWVSTMIGRSLSVFRDTADAPVLVRANGAGAMKSQRFR